jgi:AraC-like DNA-binding protein
MKKASVFSDFKSGIIISAEYGIDPQTLKNKLKLHGIDPPDPPPFTNWGNAKQFLSTFQFHSNEKFPNPFEAAAALEEVWKILLYPPWRLSRTRKRAKLFLQDVEKHFKEHHTLEFYAGRLNLTSQKLRAICRDELGRCPSECIQLRLVLEALLLLEEGDLQIQQIGFELGFDDSNYFYRFIKKNTSWNASELRAWVDAGGRDAI